MHLPAFMHDHKGSTLRIANPLLWCLPKHAEQHSFHKYTGSVGEK